MQAGKNTLLVVTRGIRKLPILAPAGRPFAATAWANPQEYALESICVSCHTLLEAWDVDLSDEFEPEFDELSEVVQDEVLAHARLLETYGPQLGRPWVDTLNGSRHANTKELRFRADTGVWRIAFAFDARRHAILLAAGDKSGVGEKRFYRKLIRKADERFDAHLERLKDTERR